MGEGLHVVCPHCSAVNRVPPEKLTAGPKCGSCKETLFTGHPVELDARSFERQLAGSLPLVVDFWATWCGPCRMMAPAFEEAARRLEPRVRLGKVDTDQERDLAARFGIRGVPTVIVFHGGREVARRSGAMDSAALMAWISAETRV